MIPCQSSRRFHRFQSYDKLGDLVSSPFPIKAVSLILPSFPLHPKKKKASCFRVRLSQPPSASKSGTASRIFLHMLTRSTLPLKATLPANFFKMVMTLRTCQANRMSLFWSIIRYSFTQTEHNIQRKLSLDLPASEPLTSPVFRKQRRMRTPLELWTHFDLFAARGPHFARSRTAK